MTTPHGPNISGFSRSYIKKLPAYITYEKFETNKGSSDYSIKCDSLKSTGDQAKELCEKFAVNLQSICKTGSTTSSPSSTLPTPTAGASGTSTTGNSINLSEAKANCLLLKYWLFNEIRKLNLGGNEKKDKNLDTLIHIIYYLQFEIYTKNGNKFYCFNDIYEYLDNWEEEKFLYEYFMNVPKIECINKNNGTDCKAYEKYVNRVKTYYNEKKKRIML
ncbi:CYIR protein [Plasmodium cynomolgi strain B]|uniref:CYIR protein n=1 Tax=Plasmodium cynomolgi (strain B) TaxID=1120755 RepID=K6V283_PLACD|nr:CYIR protein [Plasmodium cynomolgi strain B]GAB69355.1 CYIR protein [Plasmodium cynomolgi strain B]